MERETLSYLVLFCAMIVAKGNRATLEEAMMIAPLAGNASLLARELWQENSFAV